MRIQNEALILAFLMGALGEPAWADDRPSSRTFDAKGVKLHYLIQGSGEPVVLIHGLHTSAEINWNKTGVIAALAKDHLVVALDLPGHGRSDRPEKDEAYGVQMVDDVVLLLDHLKIRKAHVVGYSMGGMVALKFIADHPERAISGTLGGMGWLREGSGLQKVWERMPARQGNQTPPACVSSVGRLALGRDALDAIKVPVTVVVGDRDPVKRLYIAPLQSVRKDWPVTEIADAGHLNCIVKKEFSEAVVEWVGKHSGK